MDSLIEEDEDDGVASPSRSYEIGLDNPGVDEGKFEASAWKC